MIVLGVNGEVVSKYIRCSHCKSQLLPYTKLILFTNTILFFDRFIIQFIELYRLFIVTCLLCINTCLKPTISRLCYIIARMKRINTSMMLFITRNIGTDRPRQTTYTRLKYIIICMKWINTSVVLIIIRVKRIITRLLCIITFVKRFFVSIFHIYNQKYKYFISN